MAPEFQALAETLDSLDLDDPDARSRWWNIHEFVNDQAHGMRWYEKLILRHLANKPLREQAKADAMMLVMRVPTEGLGATRGWYTMGEMNNAVQNKLSRALARSMENTAKIDPPKVVLKRKKEVV